MSPHTKKLTIAISVLGIIILTAYAIGMKYKSINDVIRLDVTTAPAREVVVGILYADIFKPAVDGFRDGMEKNISPEDKLHIIYDMNNVTGTTKEDLLNATKLLVAKNPDLIVIMAPDLIQATKDATAEIKIPVLFAFGGNPVDEGFVKSFESSGNNLTGVTWNSGELSGKRLEILKRIVPSIKTVLILGRKNTSSQLAMRSIEDANRELKLNLVTKLIDTKTELIYGLSEIDRKKIDAISYANDPLFARNNDLIIKFAIENKLPFISHEEVFAELGALASYGGGFYQSGVVLSTHAKKILEDGISPSMIPSEKINELRLVLNNDTATMIGVEFPEDIIAVANKVIIRSRVSTTTSQ